MQLIETHTTHEMQRPIEKRNTGRLRLHRIYNTEEVDEHERSTGLDK